MFGEAGLTLPVKNNCVFLRRTQPNPVVGFSIHTEEAHFKAIEPSEKNR